MTDDTFRPGEVVRLKSGGPQMTVRGEAAVGGLICTWMHKAVLKEAVFDPAQLEKATPPAHGVVVGRTIPG